MMTDIDDTVLQAAKKWHALATEGDVRELDIFFRFVALYIAFIAILTNKYSHREYAQERGREVDVEDWQRIEWFSEELDETHRTLLTRSPSEYTEAVDYLARKRIYNMQRRRWNRQVRDKRNLKEIFDCTRYVRNNLFHAGKDPGNARDQELVKASLVVISEFVEFLLASQDKNK